MIQAPVTVDQEYNVFHMAAGIGGGLLGFKQAHRLIENFMGTGESRSARYNTVGAIDVDPRRIEAIKMISGFQGQVMDLFSYDDYVSWNSTWYNVSPGRKINASRNGGLPELVRALTRAGLEQVEQITNRRQFVLGPDSAIVFDEKLNYAVEVAIENKVVQQLTARDPFTLAELPDQCRHNLMLKRVLPPAGWREVTPEDIFNACGGIRPHVCFYSLPCKGFSGLQSDDNAASEKYQALNNLSFRAIWLLLEAFKNNPDGQVPLHIFENVPRIKDRGKPFLEKIKKLYEAYGMLVVDGVHDCGKVGKLAQKRERYILTARDPKQLPKLIYMPEEHQWQPIKAVINPLPLPQMDETGPLGPLHVLPKINMITNQRLALIPKGGDWSDLNKIVDSEEWKDGRYRIEHVEGNLYKVVVMPRVEIEVKDEGRELAMTAATALRLNHTPMGNGKGSGAYAVMDGEKPSFTVTGDGNHRKPSGAACFADVRFTTPSRDCYMQVDDADRPGRVVTSASNTTKSNGMANIADQRIPDAIIQEGWGEDTHAGKYAVVSNDDPYTTVSGARMGTGQRAIADERVDMVPGNDLMKSYTAEKTHANKFVVRGADEPLATVTGSRLGSGGAVIGDDRVIDLEDGIALPPHNGRRDDTKYKIQDAADPARCVDGVGKGVGSGQACFADIRVDNNNPNRHATLFKVSDAERPSGTVAANSHVGNGMITLADLRTPEYRNGQYGVMDADNPSFTITSAKEVSANAISVADPRFVEGAEKFGHTYRVSDEELPAGTVTSGHHPSNGSICMADSRLHGYFGRGGAEPMITADYDPGIPIIISLDGTWHRPLTIFELAQLQGFPMYLCDGRPFQLPGDSAQLWRDMVGNAVPPPSAKAYSEVMLDSLLIGSNHDPLADFDFTWAKAWFTPQGEVVEGPLHPIIWSGNKGRKATPKEREQLLAEQRRLVADHGHHPFPTPAVDAEDPTPFLAAMAVIGYNPGHLPC